MEPKGFWPWVWEVVKLYVIGIPAAYLLSEIFWVVVLILLGGAAKYIFPLMPQYDSHEASPASAKIIQMDDHH